MGILLGFLSHYISDSGYECISTVVIPMPLSLYVTIPKGLPGIDCTQPSPLELCLLGSRHGFMYP